jgi:hypothetical protein
MYDFTDFPIKSLLAIQKANSDLEDLGFGKPNDDLMLALDRGIQEKLERLAHEIIHQVEKAIRLDHPPIHAYASEILNDEGEKPNTLLHGKSYFATETDIAEMIKEAILEET